MTYRARLDHPHGTMVVVTADAYTAINELSVPYDKAATERRRDKYFGGFIFAVGGLLISLIILAVLAFLFGLFTSPSLLLVVLYCIHLGIAVARMTYLLVRWIVARRTWKKIPDGLALHIDRRGIIVAGLAVEWPQVTAIMVTTPYHWRTGSLVLTTGAQGEQSARLRVDQLPVDVSTVVSAVDIFSGGTRQVRTDWLDR